MTVARRRLAVLALASAALVAVPATVSPSLASFPDTEWTHASLTTSAIDCTTGEGFTASAAGRQVSGSLLGTDLDTIASVSGVSNAVDETGTETWEPVSAHDLDPDGTVVHTRATSLNVNALGVLPVSLPQIGTAVPGVSTGALAQYAQVSERGEALGATGLVTDQSGIVNIGEYPGSPPAHSTISLAGVLPGIAQVSDVGLEVGAVSALSEIDGCALLADQLWGVDAAAGAVRRDYEIAGLDLVVDAPTLSSLVTTVDNTVSSLQTLLNGLDATLTDGIAGELDLNLAVAQVTQSGTGVTVTVPDLAQTVSATLTSYSDPQGLVTLSPRDGRIRIDLAQTLGGESGLNGLAPNTELTLNSDVVNTLTARVGSVLDGWTKKIVDDLTAAVAQTGVAIDIDATVAALGLTVATIGLHVDANLAALTTPGSTLIGAGVSVTLLPALNNVLLAAVSAALRAVLSPLEGLLEGVISDAVTSVATSATTQLTTLGSDLAAGIAPLVTALGTLLTTLSSALSLVVNLQPDATVNPPPPNPPPSVAATSTATAEYLVTALRIGVAPAAGGGVTLLSLATASAGPVGMPAS